MLYLIICMNFSERLFDCACHYMYKFVSYGYAKSSDLWCGDFLFTDWLIEGRERSSQISSPFPLANAYIQPFPALPHNPSHPSNRGLHQFLISTNLLSKLTQISNLNYPLIRGYKISQFSFPLINNL